MNAANVGSANSAHHLRIALPAMLIIACLLSSFSIPHRVNAVRNLAFLTESADHCSVLHLSGAYIRHDKRHDTRCQTLSFSHVSRRDFTNVVIFCDPLKLLSYQTLLHFSCYDENVCNACIANVLQYSMLERTQLQGKKMKSSIQDVAQLAHVSISTVSRSFTRPDLVSKATRDKLMKAADELNFSI